MGRANLWVGGAAIALLVIIGLGWHRPLNEEARTVVRGRRTTEPITVTLRGGDCLAPRGDSSSRPAEACPAFSCKVRFSQLEALAGEGFHVKIVSEAFLVEMAPHTMPPDEAGVVCRLAPCGGPSQGVAFVPAQPDRKGTVEVEVTVCEECQGEAPGRPGDQGPGDQTAARVSIAGISRECCPLAPWTEAGRPVTFELAEVHPTLHRPGPLVEFSEVRFAGIPAECQGLTRTLSRGRPTLMLDSTNAGFGLLFTKERG